MSTVYRRGDVFRIRFLDYETLQTIKNTENIDEDQLTLGGIYTALFEGYHIDADQVLMDFAILGNNSLFTQVRIKKSEIDDERISVKCVWKSVTIYTSTGGNEMDKKIILGKNTDDVKKEYSVDISYRDVAILHHSFIGLMERVWKALKNRDKSPFKYMDLPEIDLTNFKMKILENAETGDDNSGDITVVRFYVRNVFDDSNQKWFAFREMTLRTFLPYYGNMKTGRYDFDSMWGWFRKIKVQDTERYVDLYNEAQALTWYFDGCVRKFLYNNIHAD